jgi:hypothetical protein
MKPDFDRAFNSSRFVEQPQYVSIRPLKDASAADAIARLKADEAVEDFIVFDPRPWTPPWECGNYVCDPVPLPWPPPIPPFPPEPPVVIPTDNKLTGQELLGYLLEGVMDPGNELNELQQFAALRFDDSVKPDPAAQRVLDVVDRWIGKLQSEGRTALTPEEKAQMTTEMADAAKPQFWDEIGPIIPIINPIIDAR